MKRISRRSLLAAGLSTASMLALGRVAQAQVDGELVVLAHRVHQQTATDAARPGGDVLADWRARNNRDISWLTLDVAPLHDRLLRELSLGETSLDVAYAANQAISTRLLREVEPLDAFLEDEPIEDFDDISQGMVGAVTHEGSIRAIPIRHATVGLFYNEELFAERGLSEPPTTMEELIDYARKLTYTRNDGTQVNGFAFQGNHPFNMMTMAFGFGAPLIGPSLDLLPNEDGMLQALEAMRQLFADGVMPRSFVAMGQEDVFTMVYTGRAAMALAVMGRYLDFNDPEKSQFPGRIKVTPAVVHSSLKTQTPLVATSDFWSMTIPRNSRNKALAWSLIRELSGKEATVRMALNGNGPVRASAYGDPRIIAQLPHALVEATVLPYARPPLPLFDHAQEASDIMMQTTQGVVVGQMTPEAGVAELKRRIAPLLGR